MQRYYVRLWQAIDDKVPTVQTYVQSTSEGLAVVQVMKVQHLSYVAVARCVECH